MPPEVTQEALPLETPSRPRVFTGRAVLIGLLMVVLEVGMTQALSIRRHATDVAGNAPPPTPLYLLFLYALLAATIFRGVQRRFGLTRAELLLIYVFMLIAGPVSNEVGIGFMLPHMAAPTYYVRNEPSWNLFYPLLPGWVSPRNYAAVQAFFQHGSGSVPWEAWVVPLLAWSVLLITLFFVMLCLNVIMRKQYIENERLTFPLTAIPLALSEQPATILRHGLFWLGLAIPLMLQGPAELHKYLPAIPPLPLERDFDGTSLSPPWNGMGQISVGIVFWLLGIVYLIPKDIALSAWFFYLVAMLENVLAVATGRSGAMPDVYSHDFPALYDQGGGAVFALAVITLYTARHHLRDVWRKAMGGDRTVDDRGEFLSYRTAVWGVIFGFVLMVAWCSIAGMRPWVAVLVFFLILVYFFIFARLRAETGLGMGVVLWPKVTDELVLTFVGAKYLTIPDLTILYSLRWLYFSPAVGSVMACQLEGFKLLDTGRFRGRRVGWVLALVTSLTFLLALLWTLKTYYVSGFESLPIGQAGSSMVANQSYRAGQHIVAAYFEHKGPDVSGIFGLGVGVVVTLVLSALRANFLGFPFHPVGYLAANAYGMQYNWFSFFLGWLIKSLVTRYGGLAFYRRLLMLFLGMIIGDMIHQGFWGIVAACTGTQT